jgi:ferric-dicitrate binding protein FerR (iron transport regulator)
MHSVMSIRRRARVRRLVVLALALGATGALLWHDHGFDLGATLCDVIPLAAVLIALGIMSRNDYHRRAVTVDGHPANHDERTAAWAAIRSGQLPDEPRQREAAISLARYHLKRRSSPWLAAVLWGLVTVIVVLPMPMNSPWTWLGAGVLVAIGAEAIAIIGRPRRQARALLTELPGNTAT